MFSKLKDKLKDWTKKIIEDKEEVIEIKEEEKSQKKDKKIKSEKSKTKEKITKQLEEKLEKIQEEREQTEIKKAEEEQEEKKGFFKKLFSKEKVEEAPIEEKETIKETEKIEEKIKEEPTKEKEQQTEEKKEKKSFFKKILTGTIKTSEEEKPKETEKKIQITKKESVEEKIQETQKKKSFFEKILTGTIKISEEEFNNYSEELEMLLLENNVAFEVTEKVLEELKEILKEILIEPFNIVEKIKEKSKRGEPYVILFCGINGTGKTTTIAKIAHMLKQEKLSCVIAAADTFRAAAIDQIKTHGERLDTKVIAHEYGSDPASVGFDAIKYAKKNNIPCVLIDTAGRIHTATNLLREMEKIVKVCKPDTKIFVGESITGNDAIEQVKSFNDIIGIDGIILSKADIDEKGGTALSLGYTTKKPILYLGIGQEYNQIELFDKNKFLEKLGL